jgi:hypothetical protein
MANQHGIIAGRIQPSIYGIMQGRIRQCPSAIQQEMLVEDKVTLISWPERLLASALATW